MEVARRRAGTHLVSVDSMQVYRQMDIGTAKPTAADRAEIPHHCLDLVEPGSRLHGRRVQVGTHGRARRHRPGRRAGVAGRWHRPVPPGRRRRLRPAGGVAGAARRTRLDRRHRRAPSAPRRARPGGGGQDRAEQPASGGARARGHHRQWPSVQLVRARRRRLPRQRRGADRHPATASRPDRTHRRPRPPHDRDRPRRRGAGDRRRPGLLPHVGAGARLPRNPPAPRRLDQPG